MSKGSLFLFQFHKGTIRTLPPELFNLDILEFQFHKGTIRTSASNSVWSTSQKFQFHKGTIRTQSQLMEEQARNISIP